MIDKYLIRNSLKNIIDYISDGMQPEDKKEARLLILSSQKLTVLDGILYHIEGDKTFRVDIPQVDRECLFILMKLMQEPLEDI